MHIQKARPISIFQLLIKIWCISCFYHRLNALAALETWCEGIWRQNLIKFDSLFPSFSIALPTHILCSNWADTRWVAWWGLSSEPNNDTAGLQFEFATVKIYTCLCFYLSPRCRWVSIRQPLIIGSWASFTHLQLIADFYCWNRIHSQSQGTIRECFSRLSTIGWTIFWDPPSMLFS